ncbi:MAG: FHA domain-containing protein [Magnetococcales bacterium]|nr:FHA domain-containing protein [Magnetococcales bacterium]
MSKDHEIAKTILETLSNMFGRVKRSDLKQFAEKVGESSFLDQVRHPCLVGIGRFAGEFVERAKDNRAVTIKFVQADSNQAMAEESADMGIHESLYPLIVSADQLSGSKRFRIGRSSTSDIVIPDYSISSEHADICYDKRNYRLEDLLSTNGTVVNGVPVWGKGVELRDGDKIKLGRFQFMLAWPAALYKILLAPPLQRQAEQAVPVVLEDLTDALGRFDFMYLKRYCRTHSQEEFKKLVEYPVLVGSAFFPGAAWQQEEEGIHTSRALASVKEPSKKVRPLAGHLFPLSKNPATTTEEEIFIVGRSAASDLRMNDPTISKRHARFEVKEGKVFLSDLGSSNGTTVNAVALHPSVSREINVGDRIGFGKNYFVFLSPERLHANMQEMQEGQGRSR